MINISAKTDTALNVKNRLKRWSLSRLYDDLKRKIIGFLNEKWTPDHRIVKKHLSSFVLLCQCPPQLNPFINNALVVSRTIILQQLPPPARLPLKL